MPTLASSSRAQLRYIKESTWGTTPGAGNATNLRMTGESLNFDVSKAMSKEIRSDRQNTGTTTVDAEAQGGFNFHMQYAEYDHLIEGAMFSNWSSIGTNGVSTASFSGTVTTTTITAAVAPTGADAFTNLQKGQWFQYQLAGDPNDKVWFRVSTTTAPTTTVITLDTNTPGVAAGPTAGAKIASSRLVNGTVAQSYSIEKNFADVTQFLLYKGMMVNKWTTQFQSGSITDSSFDFMGKTAVRAGATGLPGTPAASQTYDIQNGVKGIGHLWENGAPLTSTFIKALTLTADNNLRAQKALANFGSVGVGVGDFQVSGSCTVYFADGTLYDKFLNDTYTSMIWSTRDTALNGYVFTLPRVMFTSAKVVAGAENQDIMVDFDFQAYGDLQNAVTALQNTLMIDRLGPAVV